jgi:hypothetical protein
LLRLLLLLLVVRSTGVTCCLCNDVCAQIDCMPTVFVAQVRGGAREAVLIRTETLEINALAG